VEAHNGKIWAESPGEGKGARFYVSLAAEAKTEKANRRTLPVQGRGEIPPATGNL